MVCLILCGLVWLSIVYYANVFPRGEYLFKSRKLLPDSHFHKDKLFPKIMRKSTFFTAFLLRKSTISTSLFYVFMFNMLVMR